MGDALCSLYSTVLLCVYFIDDSFVKLFYIKDLKTNSVFTPSGFKAKFGFNFKTKNKIWFTTQNYCVKTILPTRPTNREMLKTTEKVKTAVNK